MPQEWYLLEGEAAQRAAVAAVAAAGMIPVADVVVNHRTAPVVDGCTREYTAFRNPPMGNDAVVKDDFKCRSSSVAYCPGGCSCGAPDTGDNFCPAPDLDHSAQSVQSLVREYLSFLQSAGYRGFRFDMVKGYGATYAGSYIAATSPAFAVGEYFDSDERKVAAWVDGTGRRSSAFDFPLRATFKWAVANDDYSRVTYYGMPGLIGLAAPHAVTFVDNHDTARDEYGGAFGGPGALQLGYALILTHPGSPCVFWAHWTESRVQPTIRALMGVRRAANLTAASSWRVEEADRGLYAAYIGDRVAVKLGSRSWSPSNSDYQLRHSGDNFAVWSQ